MGRALMACVLAVALLPASPAAAARLTPPGTMSAGQTATSPDDFALTASAGVGLAPRYIKLALSPLNQQRVLALHPSAEAAGATVVIYGAPQHGRPPTRPEDLAWTGQSVLATLVLALGLAGAGLLFLVLGRRPRRSTARRSFSTHDVSHGT